MSDLLIGQTLDRLVNEGFGTVLLSNGFTLRKDRLFSRKLGNCRQQLGLMFNRTRGQEAGYVSIYPGFVYEQLEKTVAQLKGTEPRKGWLTASANIGNLSNTCEYVEWPLTLQTDVLSLGHFIKEQIHDIAFPFWDDFSTLPNLIEGYERGDNRLTFAQSDYRWNLAAAYYLVGTTEKAIKVLESWEDSGLPTSLVESAINRLNMGL